MSIELYGAPSAPVEPQLAQNAKCPACGAGSAALLYDGGRPPAALAWCHTPDEARSLPRRPLRYVRCLDCGHVFQPAVTPVAVSSGDFEGAGEWSAFLEQVRMEMRSRIPGSPTVLAAGRKAKPFLESLAASRPRGRYVIAQPEHLAGAAAELKPHLIVSRHVPEHTYDPMGWLEALSLGAPGSLVYFEAPCIDRALETNRAEDFLHEHPSLYTTVSFSRLAARAAAAGLVSVDTLDHGYSGEVMFAFLRVLARPEYMDRARQANGFAALASASRHVIMLELANLYLAGKRVAVWGASGRGAVFFHANHVDAQRFPLVVDSDPSRAGACVPGTGQRIQSPTVLAGQTVDVLILPCPWRAMEIVEEMVRLGIRAGRVLIPYGGRLVDYVEDPHCYDRPQAPSLEPDYVHEA